MVAIVSGNGLGLLNSSFNNLGKKGVQGNANMGQAQLQNYVNLADGNLIIRQLDQNLEATGKNIQSTQTYNSKGILSEDVQWSGEWSKRLILVGNINEAGSKILVTAEDGHQVSFKFSSTNTYVSTEGSGAYDALSLNGNTWTVTDGASLVREVYEYNPVLKTGRLVAVNDNNGTNCIYSYDASDRLVSIKDLNSTSLNELIYNYDGTSNRVKRIDTKANGVTNQNVYYEYDSLNRLSKVITDLTPSDNSITDQNVYTTTYSYELSSSRITAITQSDGTSVQFSYEFDSVSNTYRVKTFKDSQGLTTFNYAANKTTVTNSLNEVWEYNYDANQQLISVKNSNTEVSSFSYDNQGNVIAVIDNEGNKLTYRYDSNGNLIEEYNHTGKAVKYSYINTSQLATITEFSNLASKDMNGNWVLPTGDAKNTNSIYDSSQRLRFVISSEGSVSEYLYNTKGQLTGKANYQSQYNIATGFAYTTVETWSKVNTRNQFSSYDYDIFGNIKRETNYSSINKTVDTTTGFINNQGVFEDATQLIDYIYDAKGLLLQKIIRHGADRQTTTLTSASTVQSFSYDGLGRILSEVSAAGTTTYSYATNQITVTNAAGLVTTQSFDNYGRLLNSIQSATNLPDRITNYSYDDAGRLVYSKQPTGTEQFNFYDKKGRLVGVVDSSGLLIEYVYNKNDLQTKEIRYATAVNSAGWLVNNNVTKKRIDEIRPVVNSLDRVIVKSYNTSNQLMTVTQENGLVTEYSYDTFGNLIQSKAGDRISRYFYNKDNLQIGVLDAEGYLVETIYNVIGQKVQVNRYSKLTTESLRATGTLAQLKPAGSDNITRSTLFFYNTQGKLVGSIDEKNFVTASIYDEKNNTVTTRQYSVATTASISNNMVWADFIAAIPASNTYQESIKYYDNQERVSKISDTRQGITSYEYDTAGRIITEKLATGGANERQVKTRYNAFGNVTHVLAGEAVNEIKVGMTAAQVDQVYEQYGIKSYYDAAGRKTQVLNAAGQLITFYYDKVGRLTHRINAEGNVVETSYTLFGEVKNTTQYANSLSKTDENVTDRAGIAIPDALTNAVGVGKRLKGGELTTTFTNLVTAIKAVAKDRVEAFEYDKLGNVSKKIDAEEIGVDYVYNQYGELEKEVRQVTLSNMRRAVQTSYTYSKRGELKSITSDQGGLNQTSSKEYDAFGRVIKETDAKGNITNLDYSLDQGRTIQIKAANNSLSQTSYDAWNRVLTVNNNNNITTYSYDDKARTLTLKSPEGLQTLTRYNEFGDLIDSTEANNGKTSYLYNKDGQKIKDTNAVGAVNSDVYDKNTGLLKETTNAIGLKIEYSYDDAGRVQSQIINLSATEKLETRYRYDGLGQRLEVIEAYGTINQRSTQYNYDKLGRLLSVVQDSTGLAATTTYVYDETGRQISITDKGVTTLYNYDALGRRISEIQDPTGITLKTQYRYDLNGNLSRKIDAAGNSTWYVYDAMNNLSYTVNSLGETSSLVYDLNGRVIAQYNFTILQDVSTWANKDIAATADITVTANITLSKSTATMTRFIYNKDGREVFSIDAEGSVVEKQYNELGKVTHVISYDKSINLVGESLTQEAIRAALQTANASSKTESSYYDVLGRVIYTMDAVGYVTRNAYDAMNNLTQALYFKEKTTLNHASTLAQMDAVYKSATLPAYSVRYMYYDKLGRKIYDLNQISMLTRYSYDELGNLVSKKETAVIYVTLLDLLRTKDVNGAFTSDRPAATTDNYDAGLKLLADSQYRETNYYYDKLGRMKYIIDALGYVTRFNHNALNNVTNTVKYYDAISLSRSSTLEQLNEVYLGTTPLPYTVTGTLYNVAGRKILEVNEMTFFTYYSYDALGNVVSKKESTFTVGELLDYLRTKDANGNYTTERPTTTLANCIQAMSLVPATKLRETKYYYDKVGRVTYDINALGYVTSYSYDALGNLISSKQSNLNSDAILDLLRTKDVSGNFTTLRPELNSDNLQKAFKLVTAANYRESSSYYDKNGRLNYSIDALGYVTRYSYDAYGNLSNTARFNAVTVSRGGNTLAQLDAVFRTAATLPEYTITQYGYDALNRKIKETDAEGFSVETSYDAFDNAVWVKDKLGNKGYFYYDAMNRNTGKIDAAGYYTFYSYDAFGNQLSEGKYLATVNGLDKIEGATGLLNAVKVIPTSTEAAPTTQPYLNYGTQYTVVNNYQYDKLNRKIRITDVLGNYEEYTYNNGFSQPATYRNKLAGVYSYLYDQLGYLIQETLPEKSSGLDVINTYEYDAFGNRTKLTEAKGLAEQRISVYEYDGLNRLITKVGEAVDVVQLKALDLSKPDIEDKVVTTGVIPRESYQYDSYGNQILKTDANGAKTFSYYDQNGRKIAEINSVGLLTQWEYNASGQVIKLKSYETPVALPTLAGGALPVAPIGNFRVVEYGYDKVGRQTQVKTPDVYTYDYDADGKGSLLKQSAIEKSYYDGNGNLIRIEDAKGGITYHYYDAIGRKILTVDAGGYATQWIYDYDAVNKVNTLTENKYVQKLTGQIKFTDQFSQVQALLVVDNINDRKTISTFDRKGRVLKTELLNVQYTDGITLKVDKSTTSFTYNALDKVLTKTDSTGTVKTGYDKLGRETIRTFGEYQDSNSITVSQRISSVYNGLGLLASSAVLGANDSVTTDDRVTQYTYDRLGRLIKERDVNLNHSVNYAYDLVGNQTWVSTTRKTSTTVIKIDETLIEYNQLGKEITRRVNEGSCPLQSSTTITWKTLEQRETRYNVFGEVTGKRLVKPDSVTKATDSWQEVTEYNNQGKVWKSNANNGVTHYYLYDQNGNATLQLDTAGTTTITAKTPDQLKDLMGVTYTETIYDKRNQVITIRQPKFSQETLDTTLNLFNQTISRSDEKSTVILEDTSHKLIFNENTQKLSIQTNTQAKRLVIKYWPKDGDVIAENTLTVDMQVGTVAGEFVLDISAIKANVDFSFSYSSSDAIGTVLESSTGTVRRSVNIIDKFTGGNVTANPNAVKNVVSTTMGTVALDSTFNYAVPVTINGISQQIVTSRNDWPSSSGSGVTVNYDEVISVQSLKIGIPTLVKSFGDGNFEVELIVDSQVYTQSVSATTSSLTIVLDKNIDKVLNGKTYNIKIYKRVNTTTAELLLNQSNTLPAKISQIYTQKWKYVDDSNPPPLMVAKVGAVINVGVKELNQEVILNNYNQLVINNVPVETSRVEVKYKLQGVSQWSTLISNAALYNNISNFYQINLSALDRDKNYDYQYIMYSSHGDVIGGSQGVINTTINQASVTQGVLESSEFQNNYIDKKETLNSHQDSLTAIMSLESSIALSINSTYAPVDIPIIFQYKFDNNILKKYMGNGDFVILIKNTKLNKSVEKRFIISGGSEFTNVDVDITSLSELIKGNHNNFEIQVAKIDSGRLINIGNGSVSFDVTIIPPVYNPRPYREVKINSSSLILTKKNIINLNNQSINSDDVILYYKELGSNQYFNSLNDNYSLKDIYGAKVDGSFDINISSLSSGKKYEIQYITLSGSTIVNRQQGILDLTGATAKIDVTPLNYGGDGFVVFNENKINFIDQFALTNATQSSAQLKIRKTGTTVWENISLSSFQPNTNTNTNIRNWFQWDYGLRTGEYEFLLDSFNGNDLSNPVNSILGKVRLGAQPQVLNYIPKSFVQNQIVFSGQPVGSKTVTVKYGTVAGQFNQTAVLTLGTDGQAILDATTVAEMNLLGSTTVYYSYETTDEKNKLLNRATGYINIGLGAGLGQHTSQLNDSWLDLQPAQNNGIKMELSYRKRQIDANGNFVSDLVNDDNAYLDGKSQFTTVTLTPQNGVYRWNVNSLVPNSGLDNYEYFYQLYDANGKVIAFVPGQVTIDSNGNGSTQQTKWTINGSGSEQNQIIRSQSYNAFGEIISETDGNGNTTTLSYNTLGKLTKKTSPKVDIRKTDGSVIQDNPTIEYAYDLAGRLLTTKDANGNINKQNYLNGHNLETGDWLVANEIHADTGQVVNGYDVFGNLTNKTNELGIKIGYEYDITGNLTKITREARTTYTLIESPTSFTNIGNIIPYNSTTSAQQTLADTFAYDELGNRISTSNALGNIITTDYDALGRVIQNRSAEGVVSRIDYAYDATISNINGTQGGIKRTETDALGKTIIDEQDYYGRNIKHTDKGGHVFNYTYNTAGWLIRQTNTQGQNIDYSYYSNGSIKEIRDVSLNLLTAYRYDDNGNRIEERYQELNAKLGEPRIFQNALINYDSLNRKISVQDQTFSTHYEYDANGNIIHMLANYRDAVNATPKIQDFWYSYDNMNRFTVSMGVLNSTTKKVERGDTGILVTYDKLGQRLSADYGKDALNSTKAHKESYSYTADGYIETVKSADYGTNGVLGTEYILSVRRSDALGRVIMYQEYNPNSNTVYQATTTVYSKDNQVSSQTKVGGNGAGTTTYTYLADKSTLDNVVMKPTSGSSQTTQYTYEWWDSAKQKEIKLTVDNLVGKTSFNYDVNGHISGFVDEQNAQNKRAATYINNSQGMVLQRNELINNSISRYRNFYYIDGQKVGDASNDGPSREDYVQNIQSSRATPVQAKDFKPIASADFDENFEPINAQYPSSAATTYVVNNGDTLQSIALAIWGDASMWYLLADVNGLNASDRLTADQVLTVPNKVTNIHNNSETFRAYNPGEAIGNTQPTIPTPPPPAKPKKKCGGIAQIVMIVVAVVVTIYTAGAAAVYLGAGGSSLFAAGTAAMVGGGTTMATGVAIGSAMIGAAVGSAASQLAGKAMGAVDHFSWSQVGVSALTAGLTAGAGAGIGQLANNYNWANTASNAIKAVNASKAGWTQVLGVGAYSGVVGYGSGYIANQIFGNNQTFSWATLGSSIVGSMAGAGLGKLEENILAKAANAAAYNQISPYTNALAGANAAAVIDDKWFGGAKPDYLNVSMAAIANTAGRQFGEGVKSWRKNNSNDDIVTNFNEDKFLSQISKEISSKSLYAFSMDEGIAKAKHYIDGIKEYINRGVDLIGDVFSDHTPNTSKENILYGMNKSTLGDEDSLPIITVNANKYKNSSITYALGGANSTYNIRDALARVERQVRSQHEAIISPLNPVEAFYQTRVGTYVNAWKTGTINMYKGALTFGRELAYTSYDASIGSVLKSMNPNTKPVSWLAQSIESNGFISTSQSMLTGMVNETLEPLRALNKGDYVGFTETIPNLIASTMGVRATTLPNHPSRFKFDVNQQGIPYSYLENISDINNIEIRVLESKYYDLEARGADYKSLVRNYVDSNKFGLNLEDAHYIMGYTTNYFQSDLNKQLFTGEVVLSSSQMRTINSINSALDKLPSQNGVFFRGLDAPDWFDYKYANDQTVYDRHFSSISRNLSDNYKGDRVMTIFAKNAKDISALAMDVNFAKYIGQTPTTSEFVIRSGTKYNVLDNDGIQHVIIKEK
ncbi:LysM peptidoglycan-binding domain-containing protein [Acinetobacter sp. ANC 5383]